LRSLTDCRAIIASADGARSAVVIGASFIGARGRGEPARAEHRGPRRRAGAAADGARARTRHGRLCARLHEEHGVIFHLGDTVTAIHGKSATLKSGGVLEAGSRGCRRRRPAAPCTGEKAGLAIDRGVTVNAYLETSVAGIYAAGDIRTLARSAFRREYSRRALGGGGAPGPDCARNMLGQREAFDAVPFFWSQHYDVPINYVGHAEKWDGIEIDGDIAGKDCLLRYKSGGRVLRLPRSIAMSRASRLKLRWSGRRRLPKSTAEAEKTSSASCPGLSWASTSLKLPAIKTQMAGTKPGHDGKALGTNQGDHHAYRSRHLPRTLPQFSLGYSRALQSRDRLLRPPRRRKRRLALIYVDEDGGTTRTSFDEVADMSRRFANVLKADGLRAAIASQCFCRNPSNCRSRIWRHFRSGMISIPLFCAVWRGRAGIPPGEFGGQSHHHR